MLGVARRRIIALFAISGGEPISISPHADTALKRRPLSDAYGPLRVAFLPPCGSPYGPLRVALLPLRLDVAIQVYVGALATPRRRTNFIGDAHDDWALRTSTL